MGLFAVYQILLLGGKHFNKITYGQKPRLGWQADFGLYFWNSLV